MNDIILHHYPTSPYAEKIRVIFGIKSLAWRSVIIPMMMPKPDLVPLTGGYRKTPVMQIGADIYCDTQCIARELERRYPEPTLYRGIDAGIANAMAFWSERSMFQPAVGVAFTNRSDDLPPGFLEDRSKMVGREVSVERMKAGAPFMIDQLRAQLDWYETALSDGREFLSGPHPTLVDVAAYHPCWFMHRNGTVPVAPLSEFPNVLGWMERVRALGHGQRSDMSSQDALAVAKAATPHTQPQPDLHDPLGRKVGDIVDITPDDT
ncbi:MAG TPA: glutathione S-transferase family protein, partial [Steroidobacteraceae bacterium]|nr:glutathione S-transferase family protein [Steroidobacteraceae bacterium]